MLVNLVPQMLALHVWEANAPEPNHRSSHRNAGPQTARFDSAGSRP